MKPISTYLFIFICLFMFSCKKENNQQVKHLTANDSNGKVTVVKGERIILTLGNPGDGGYQFNNPTYNDKILVLVSHEHQNAKNSQLIGDFGKDLWTFKASAAGTSSLTVTASRGGITGETITIFTNEITVQ